MKKIFIIVLVLLGWYACSDESEVPQISGIETTTFTDNRDGNTYQCIVVNGKTWMAENLRYRLPLGSLDGCYSFKENTVDTSRIEVSGEIYATLVTEALETGELVDTDGKIARYLPFLTNGMWNVENFINTICQLRPELEEKLLGYEKKAKERSMLQMI